MELKQAITTCLSTLMFVNYPKKDVIYSILPVVDHEKSQYRRFSITSENLDNTTLHVPLNQLYVQNSHKIMQAMHDFLKKSFT